MTWVAGTFFSAMSRRTTVTLTASFSAACSSVTVVELTAAGSNAATPRRWRNVRTRSSLQPFPAPVLRPSRFSVAAIRSSEYLPAICLTTSTASSAVHLRCLARRVLLDSELRVSPTRPMDQEHDLSSRLVSVGENLVNEDSDDPLFEPHVC